MNINSSKFGELSHIYYIHNYSTVLKNKRHEGYFIKPIVYVDTISLNNNKITSPIIFLISIVHERKGWSLFSFKLIRYNICNTHTKHIAKSSFFNHPQSSNAQKIPSPIRIFLVTKYFNRNMIFLLAAN